MGTVSDEWGQTTSVVEMRSSCWDGGPEEVCIKLGPIHYDRLVAPQSAAFKVKFLWSAIAEGMILVFFRIYYIGFKANIQMSAVASRSGPASALGLRTPRSDVSGG